MAVDLEKASDLPPGEPSQASAPTKPNFSVLQDRLADLIGDEPHPLDTEEAAEPPAPAAVVESPAVQSAQPTASTHPKDLIAAARNLGIDERYLAPGEVSTLALTDWVVRERLKDQALANRQVPSQMEKIAPVDEDAATLEYLEKEVMVDPKLVEYMRRQAEEIKRLKGITGDVEQIRQRDVARETATNNEIIDSAIESLGPDFELYLGKGALAEIGPDSPDAMMRLKIARQAGIDWQKDSAKTKQQKFISAAKEFLKDKIRQAPPATPAASYEDPPKNGKKPPTTQEWDNASLGRPAGKASTKGQKASRQALHDAMRELGITDFDGRQEELEGVPG